MQRAHISYSWNTKPAQRTKCSTKSTLSSHQQDHKIKNKTDQFVRRFEMFFLFFSFYTIQLKTEKETFVEKNESTTATTNKSEEMKKANINILFLTM